MRSSRRTRWAAAGLVGLSLAGLTFAGPGTRRPTAGPAPAPAPAPGSASRAGWTAGLDPGGARFEANRGQADARVRYVARGRGYALFLTPDEAVLALQGRADPSGDAGGADPTVVRMRVLGARRGQEPAGERPLPGTTNSFLGRDPARWITGIPSFGAVRYAEVRRGVDVVYRGQGASLEYDLVLQPGADLSGIALAFEGADRVSVDPAGDLVLATASGDLRQERPFVYQEVAGARRRVAGAYVVNADATVGFRVGPHDPAVPLVIDPVLTYSTFLAGTSDERARAVASGSGGTTFVTGETFSADFPSKGSLAPRQNGTDVFVTRIDRTEDGGSALGYSTYLGGSANESGLGLAVDGAGRAWVVGETTSTEFPTTPGALQAARQTQASTSPDAFVARLDPAGGGVVLGYSSYFGTPADDSATGVAVDPSANAWVTGVTTSPDGLPTTEGAAGRAAAGGRDAFVARFDARQDGSASLLASTYLGGSLDEVATSVAVDTEGDGTAFVAGQTVSPDLPVTPGALQPGGGGGPATATDAFIAGVGPAADLSYASYLGGGDRDSASGIAVKGARVHVTGQTFSGDFPVTAGALRTTPAQAGNADAYVSVIDTGVAGPPALAYSTYLGGPTSSDVFVLPTCRCSGTAVVGRGERGAGVAVGPTGLVYVAGETTSKAFPVTAGAFQAAKSGPDSGTQASPGLAVDGFVASLDPARTGDASLVYASYLGGSAEDVVSGVAVRAPSTAVVAGFTQSVDFPVLRGALQEQAGGVADAFVSEVSAADAVTPRVTAIAPRGGPTGGGTRVRLTGEGLGGVTGVRFGDLAAAFTVDSATQVTAVAPAQPAGAVSVSVATAAASSFITPATRYVYGDEGAWAAAAPLASTRHGHTATLLGGGRVLVAGGSSTPDGRTPVRVAERYGPVTGTWTAAGPMRRARSFHSATLLRNGKVLVVGGMIFTGAELPLAELFDPTQADLGLAWTDTASLAVGRYGHTATLLADGRVLVAGGANSAKRAIASAEVYDPATGTWATVGPMAAARYGHTATLLADGRVLVVGGANSSDPSVAVQTTEPIPSAELFDPATGVWRPTCAASAAVCAGAGAHPQPRLFASAAALADGRVLVAGGLVSLRSLPTASSEIFDPAATDPARAWLPTGRLATGRFGAASTVLPGERPFVVGGSSPDRLSDGATFDLATGTWRAVPSMLAARGVAQGSVAIPGPTATVLSSDPRTLAVDPAACGSACGKVLVLGGSGDPSAEIYTPTPTVASVTPPVSPPEGGGRVTLTGTGFTHGVADVTFGGIPSPSVTVSSYFRLTAVVPPAGADRSVDVVVTGAGGSGTWAQQFLYDGPPEAVRDLAADAVSPTRVDLSFSAPGSNGNTPPPATLYVVKLALGPLSDLAAFDAAVALCGGVCALAPTRIGDRVALSVTDLSPGTTYRFALRPQDGAGRLGPLSNMAEATTPGATATPTTEPGAPATPAPAGRRRAAAATTTTTTATPGRPRTGATPAGARTTTPTTTAPTTSPGDDLVASASPVPPDGLLSGRPHDGGSPAWKIVLAVLVLGLAAALGAYLNRRYRGSAPTPAPGP